MRIGKEGMDGDSMVREEWKREKWKREKWRNGEMEE
jgi:hypothetical protein